MTKIKYSEEQNFDGSKTFTPVSGSVGFYNPFVLLKKDFKPGKNNVTDSFKFIYFFILVIQAINSDNRISKYQLNKIGEEVELSEVTISRLTKMLCDNDILIKFSRGVYKVNEDMCLFKQDQKGYLALKRETKSVTNNTQNITNNINILNPSETLLAKLLAKGAKINSQNASDIEEF
jgi:hypothetical protein